MKNNLDLILNGPVLKMICKLSLPNSITGISMVLIVISDAYFVSKLGNVSLASLALVFPFITLMQMMSAGAIGGASTSSISRFLGANLIESANSAIWHAVLIGISMSIIYSVIFVLFPKYIFMSMGGDNDVLEGAVNFSQIAFGGAVFTWLLYILSAVLRALKTAERIYNNQVNTAPPKAICEKLTAPSKTSLSPPIDIKIYFGNKTKITE